MTSKPANPLKSILHPYIFVLKEGGEIKKDFLDYSLMILFIHSRETIRSPSNEDWLLDKTLNVKKKKSIISKKSAPTYKKTNLTP